MVHSVFVSYIRFDAFLASTNSNALPHRQNRCFVHRIALNKFPKQFPKGSKLLPPHQPPVAVHTLPVIPIPTGLPTLICMLCSAHCATLLCPPIVAVSGTLPLYSWPTLEDFPPGRPPVLQCAVAFAVGLRSSA